MAGNDDMAGGTASIAAATSGDHRTGLRPGSGFRHPAQNQLMVLLAVAVLFGGGGVGFGLFNLAVQLCAIAMLAFNPRAVAEFVTRGPRVLVCLVLASLALPLIQAIPLPPSLWHELPGRDLVRDSLALIGREQSWFPLSVDSDRTLGAAISLLPCVAVLVLAQRLDEEGIGWTFRLLVWLGLVNLVFGAVQLASGNAHGNFYPGGDPATVYGTFANRNSTALFLDIALVAALWLPASSRDVFSRGLRMLIAALLALGVLLTQSRTGTVLMAVAIVARVALLAWPSALRFDRPARSRRRLLLAGLALAVLVAGGFLATNQKLGQTFARFESLDDERVAIWKDTLASASRFWPVGSGISTFDEVFQVDESLETLNSKRAGRAHNDYLELALESGAIGIALAAAWIAWLARQGWQAVRSPDRLLQRGALLALLFVMLQSITDYPLRNQALLCVAAFMVNVIGRYPKVAATGKVNH